MLCDQTYVGETQWKDLKHKALNMFYQKTKPFLKLTDSDKKLVRALIAAQLAQGDLDELKPLVVDAELLEMVNSQKYAFA